MSRYTSKPVSQKIAEAGEIIMDGSREVALCENKLCATPVLLEVNALDAELANSRNALARAKGCLEAIWKRYDDAELRTKAKEAYEDIERALT